MSTLTVQIMLHGLIALMPVNDSTGAANHMKALLVEARQPPAGVSVECFAAHHPMLKVTTMTSSECQAVPGCTANSLECTCDLTRKDLTLLVQPAFEPPRQQLSKRPPSSLPFSFETAGDFGYIANLAQPPLSRTIDPAVLEAVPPSTLVARMDFPFTSVTACSLGLRRDEQSNNVHPMSFRPLSTTEQPGELNQALAQVVTSSLAIPFSGTAVPQVTIAIGEFGSGDLKFLTLKHANNKINIELMNERVSLPIDDPCDDGVGRDFAFFYQILQNPPAWKERPIPHVKYTRWKSARDLEANGCETFKDPMSRPICPMGIINP